MLAFQPELCTRGRLKFIERLGEKAPFSELLNTMDPPGIFNECINKASENILYVTQIIWKHHQGTDHPCSWHNESKWVLTAEQSSIMREGKHTYTNTQIFSYIYATIGLHTSKPLIYRLSK